MSPVLTVLNNIWNTITNLPSDFYNTIVKAVNSVLSTALSHLVSWVDQILTEALRFFISILLAPLNQMLQFFATSGELHNLLNAPWAQNLIAGTQGIAFAILATRTAWEAFQLATLRAEGAPTDPGGLLKRVVLTAAAIAGGPWVAKEALLLGNDLAQGIASAGFGVGLDQLSTSIGTMFSMATGALFWEVFIVAFGAVLIILCFIQSMVRTIEITLIAIVSPVMALGFMSGGGTADVWWRETLVVCTSQAVQILLLYVAAVQLVTPVSPGAPGFALGPFLFLGALWVAWRTPHILRQYAYHTGASAAAGNVAGTVAGQVGARMLMAKLPF